MSQSPDMHPVCRTFKGCKHCRAATDKGRECRARYARTILAPFNLSRDWDCPHGRGPVGTVVEIPPPRGLGDTIAKIADPVANLLGLQGCGGCAKRQAALNALVPYHSDDLTTPGK